MISRSELKASIQALSLNIHRHRRVSGTARDRVWQYDMAQMLGHVRLFHLAYAFLRGVPYQAVENNAKVYCGHYPYIMGILKVLQEPLDSLVGAEIRNWVNATAFGPWPHPSLRPKQREAIARELYGRYWQKVMAKPAEEMYTTPSPARVMQSSLGRLPGDLKAPRSAE